MLPILISLVLWIPSVYGWALPFVWIRRRFYEADAVDYEETEAVLGLYVLATLVNLFNLFVAIDGLIASIMLVTGWILALLRFRADRKGNSSKVAIAVGIFWVVMLAMAAAQPPRHSDTGLYHLQSIAWLTTAPLAPGLGNLHSRLAFNSAWFSVAAAVEIPFISGNSSFIVLPLILWFWGMAISRSVTRLLRSRSTGLPDVFMAVSGGAISLGSGSIAYYISSPEPDLAVVVLTIFLTYVFCQFLTREDSRDYDLFILLSLSTFAITVKLSVLPLLLLPTVGLKFASLQKREPVNWRKWTLLALAVSLPTLAIWLVRGFVLSGCWIYPLDLTCWPRMSWSVPHSVVNSEYEWIRSWARLPGQSPNVVLANWDWFWVWLPTTLQQPSFSWPIIIFAVGIIGQWSVSRGAPIRRTRSPLILYAVLSLGVIYWFLTAPAIRFGEGYFWSLALLSLSEWLTHPQQLATARAVALQRLAALAFALLAMLTPLTLALAQAPQFLSAPRSFLLTWPTMPMALTKAMRTENGTVVYIPVTGNECWRAPLPCTPYFLYQLQIRRLPDSRLSFAITPDALK